MDMKEKLVELLNSLQDYGIKRTQGLALPGLPCNEIIADHLIANGVTVKECAEWEEIEDDWNMETIYKCSACKEEFVTIDGTPADNLWNYCPHCGAKMIHQPPKGE